MYIKTLGRAASLRVYAHDGTRVLSFMHDIPLTPQAGLLTMVNEIPRWSNTKLEISLTHAMNPIVPDIKKGVVRQIPNLFPFKGYLCNYGALPQTWEDPLKTDEYTGLVGDNDPIDVCEIGSTILATGQLATVKVLGCLAMIDSGETDWKVIAIRHDDPLAASINSIADVDVYMPGLLRSLRNWFRDYKLPDGKPQNKFAFGGEYKDRDFALDVIEHGHLAWRQLVTDPKIATRADVSIFADESLQVDGDLVTPHVDTSSPHAWFYS